MHIEAAIRSRQGAAAAALLLEWWQPFCDQIKTHARAHVVLMRAWFIWEGGALPLRGGWENPAHSCDRVFVEVERDGC